MQLLSLTHSQGPEVVLLPLPSSHRTQPLKEVTRILGFCLFRPQLGQSFLWDSADLTDGLTLHYEPLSHLALHLLEELLGSRELP